MLFAMREGIIEAGFKFSQLLVWIKNNAPIGRLDYLPQFELIGYGWLGTHAFQKSQDKSVIFYPKPSKNPLHPTQKPVGLLRRLVLNSSRINDYVYDPFAGSGTLGIACEQTKRICIVELDFLYTDKNGDIHNEDTKGFITALSSLKRKLLKAATGIVVEIVK